MQKKQLNFRSYYIILAVMLFVLMIVSARVGAVSLSYEKFLRLSATRLALI